eukprot:CAMPEP_0119089020 /NCGR_PEP_ID=MMETSP1178-20130426/147560_1 /TAXON_ID=33656 /ORGANISM="unid sp, Strain CCMP2000" /LENGTH=31 /DNA_ID= /DNA_START= /DNA_END= /DNA_ORIENTATION=
MSRSAHELTEPSKCRHASAAPKKRPRTSAPR